jgi:hypothetical protein
MVDDVFFTFEKKTCRKAVEGGGQAGFACLIVEIVVHDSFLSLCDE